MASQASQDSYDQTANPSRGLMELWLAAIIGFSIGYLLAPLFYDH